MSKREHEHDEPTADDARFVERLRAVYAPEPMDAARRTAFDARLRERLERPRWRGAWIPACSAAVIAALAVWYALPGTRAPEPAPVAAASESAGTAWEQALFYGDLTHDHAGSENEELPPDYMAIEVAFFDGV